MAKFKIIKSAASSCSSGTFDGVEYWHRYGSVFVLELIDPAIKDCKIVVTGAPSGMFNIDFNNPSGEVEVDITSGEVSD